MTLDSAFAGRVYPDAATYQVGREKIREFADAIGDRSAVLRDPDAARVAGHPDIPAPPTFAAIVAMQSWSVLLDDPDLGLDFGRVVHGDQSFTHHRPVHAGDALTATLHVDAIRAVGGTDMLTLRCEIADAAGNAVSTARSTLVARGADG